MRVIKTSMIKWKCPYDGWIVPNSENECPYCGRSKDEEY